MSKQEAAKRIEDLLTQAVAEYSLYYEKHGSLPTIEKRIRISISKNTSRYLYVRLGEEDVEGNA